MPGVTDPVSDNYILLPIAQEPTYMVVDLDQLSDDVITYEDVLHFILTLRSDGRTEQ